MYQSAQIGQPISANQLVGKTVTLKRPTRFYRVDDVNKLGDKATPVKNLLPVGYRMLIDSYLASGPGYTGNYYIKYAARSDNYLTFWGKDRVYYAIKGKDFSLDKKGREEAGVKTVVEEREEEQQQKKTTWDKLFEGFGKFANFAKYLTIGIAAVWATGYIIKQTKK